MKTIDWLFIFLGSLMVRRWHVEAHAMCSTLISTVAEAYMVTRQLAHRHITLNFSRMHAPVHIAMRMTIRRVFLHALMLIISSPSAPRGE